MQLTPVAALQGEVAAANILAEDSAEADYKGIPTAIHSIPVLASVGIGAGEDSDKYKVVFKEAACTQQIRQEWSLQLQR